MEQYILANFGGPRNLEEIEEFLCELLTDQDVVRSDLRPFFHRLLFRKIAKRRAPKVAKDYQKIGGRSPIFEDTEALAKALEERLGSVVVPFHRYLPKTHPKFGKGPILWGCKLDRLSSLPAVFLRHQRQLRPLLCR